MIFVMFSYWLEATLTASLLIGATLGIYALGKLVSAALSAIRKH